MGILSWQSVALILTSILIAGGVITYTSLLGSLFQLKGITYSNSGDKMCEYTCDSYIDVNTSYWRVCFGHYDNTKYEGETLFKKVTLSRTLHVNLDNVKNIISTEPEITVDWNVPARSGWRNIQDGDCWERGKVNKIQLVGHKQKEQTVQWGFELGGYVSAT